MINFGRLVWILVKGAPVKGAIEIKNGWSKRDRKRTFDLNLGCSHFVLLGVGKLNVTNVRGDR